MEKLIDKTFLLILNGPSCGGKSTVARVLLQRYGTLFNAAFDTIKWLISDYTPDRDREVVFQMTLATVRVALENNISVLKQGALHNPEEIIAIAKELKVPYVVANISAPLPVLEERFKERITAHSSGHKISNTSHERFLQLRLMYLDTKMDTPLEFDSSVSSPEEIADTIARYIKENI